MTEAIQWPSYANLCETGVTEGVFCQKVLSDLTLLDLNNFF